MASLNVGWTTPTLYRNMDALRTLLHNLRPSILYFRKCAVTSSVNPLSSSHRSKSQCDMFLNVRPCICQSSNCSVDSNLELRHDRVGEGHALCCADFEAFLSCGPPHAVTTMLTPLLCPLTDSGDATRGVTMPFRV